MTRYVAVHFPPIIIPFSDLLMASFTNIHFNSNSSHWDVSVRIPTKGICQLPVESLGSYLTEKRAKKALDQFKSYGLSGDQATMMALRMRAAAAEANVQRLQKEVVQLNTQGPPASDVFFEFCPDTNDDHTAMFEKARQERWKRMRNANTPSPQPKIPDAETLYTLMMETCYC